jgi:hypothetical protein
MDTSDNYDPVTGTYPEISNCFEMKFHARITSVNHLTKMMWLKSSWYVRYTELLEFQYR